ncbi:MAG: CCA tRNA nucleotidyltransferase [Clostridia bacterium]|nr:CCA tRNA nucleotidyltransferase [Clostridia bacterium]
MQIQITDTLRSLAEIFHNSGSTLYIVGGYVRNAILGFCETDIDLCGDMTVEELRNILDKDLYKVEVVNPKLGTVHILPRFSDEEFEYTTFRAENYSAGGAHSPEDVVFVKDISQDASRRDFTANAIYYDIYNDTIVDFYDGVNDVNSRILRTVETPNYVFSNDGLRMLRLVRIASELDFSIDDTCFDTAINMVSQLKDISHERFNKEIVSILFADYKYHHIHNPHAPVMGVNLLSKMHAWQYIFPKLAEIVGVDTFNTRLQGNWCQLLALAPPPHRITAFVVDILRTLELPPTSQYIRDILGVSGIMLQKSEVQLQTNIILAYYDILNGFRDDTTMRLFIQAHSNMLDRILGFTSLSMDVNNFYLTRDLMVMDGVPMTLQDLAITGNDLIEHFPQIQKQQYSTILRELLSTCCLMPEANTREKLFSIIKYKFDK